MANSFAGRIKSFFGFKDAASEELFEDLGDLLVEGDFGAAEAFRVVDALRDLCRKEKITGGEGIRRALADLLEGELLKARSGSGRVQDRAGPFDPAAVLGGGLGVILLLGVNGVGKTTSAAKLAEYYRSRCGRRPILAAADTFRAAAIDQLKIHGERLGLRVVAHQHGGDPAAVVYDAVEAAQAGGGDLILADTAGRMHTKSSLVEELKKIDRVVESKAGEARYLKWLVLDATTGRNALVQAETFHGAVALDGVILTKYDSGARGGAAFSLAAELGLPLVFICTGEQYGDIAPFDPRGYAREFAGLA
ncbi:MAG: signal recognition particle-docking protein FtsY [Treponema sp.]|nr:signal recognition particle-docking protein FtsY [Treponema sp.]